MVQYGPTWSNMVQYGPNLSQKPYKLVRHNQVPWSSLYLAHHVLRLARLGVHHIESKSEFLADTRSQQKKVAPCWEFIEILKVFFWNYAEKNRVFLDQEVITV